MENSKHLPIKFFQKRISDERKTEGGGSKTEPKWLLNEEDLATRSQEFSELIDYEIELLRNRTKEFDFIPTVLNLTIDDNAIAKTHRTAIKKVFNVNNKSNIIGFSKANNLLVKIDSVEDALEIKENIGHFNKNPIALSAIEDLSSFEPLVLVDEHAVTGLENSYKISLLNYYDTAMNNAVKATFEKFCQTIDVELKETFYSPDLIIYKAKKINADNLRELKSFAALESFSFMPRYQVSLDCLEDKIDVPIKKPIDGVEYPIVGILDSGIAKIDHLSPWLAETNYSSYPDEYKNQSHGTFVSGVLLYGDELENERHTGLEGCKLFDATVFPESSIDEDELIDNVREAIRRNPQIKIWNMSLGTNQTAEADTFSDFGIALDNIQEVNNVLICKSAGNCSNFIKNRPVSRIAKSADSVRSLVVGSIAHKKSPHDIAEINHPSPFSRIGHAPAGIIKPELVSYGGNAGVNDIGKSVISGVNSFGINGEIMTAVGTSFSTPRVSALIAALDYRTKVPNLRS
ncbi:MAG: S8 family peptidase [Tissierellales bacterium]|nr:S8 family peptidase [Tissierellales bacterium]